MSPASVKAIAAVALALGAASLAGGRQEGRPAVDRHGDPLPPRAVARLGTLRFRVNGSVHQVAVVPGGKRLLGLDTYAPAVILWEETGREVRRFAVPPKRPAPREDGVEFHHVTFESFAVSPDGKTLAVGTAYGSELDCPLLLFDVATGRKLAEWPGHRIDGFSAHPFLAFVAPGLLVSAGADGSVRSWDVATQRELHRLTLPAGGHVSALVASPDRKHVFVAGWDDREAAFWMAWDAAAGKVVHRERDPEGLFVKLAPSPDGASLALCMGKGPRHADGPWHAEMRLYSVPTWKERRRWRAPEGDDPSRTSIAFSPDGKVIAAGGADGKVRRWDAATGKELGPAIEPCQKYCQQVAFLDDATVFTFGFQSTVLFWDVRTGKPKFVFTGAESQPRALAYSPDGRHVAAGGSDGIRIWEAASGGQVAHLRDGFSDVTCLAFSPDGRFLVSGDTGGVGRLWDWAEVGAPVKTFSDHKSPLYSVAFRPGGKALATGDEAGVVRVWAHPAGRPVRTLKAPAFEGRFSAASALAFTGDGQALFSSASGDGVRQWDLTAGKEVRLTGPESLGHSNAVSGMALSPGGRWGYSSSYDGSICVWESATGQLARVLKGREPGYNGPFTIALSPDGTRLAAAPLHDWEDPSVHLWDLTAGREIATLTGHRAPVTRLAFSPDGRRLASGSCDTTALVWDVTGLGPGGKAPDGKALAGLWDELGAGDPKGVYAAVCRGAAAGDAAVARLKRDLKPAVAVDAEKVAAWVRRLDADEYARRQQASAALAGLGPEAEAAVREALGKARSLEVRRRLERVLEGQEAEHRRLGHALEVLEMTGTPAARRLLADLARGAGNSRLTREARLALDRLARRP